MITQSFLAISILFISISCLAYGNKCKDTQTPPWVEREVKSVFDQIPKSNFVQNTFPATITGKRFTLNYTKYPALTPPSKGTIVYLCGGPGLPCNLGRLRPSLPDGYDIIAMDYLGIGDNKKVKKPNEMAIDSQASAIEQLVRYTKPKNLIIYGESFGTTVATAAAAKLTSPGSKNNPPLIKGVFLEGVVGRGNFGDYAKSFSNAAETAWNLLNDEEKDKFKKYYGDTAKKLTPDEMTAFGSNISNQLSQGSLIAADYLKSVPNMSIKDLKKSFKMSIAWRKSQTTGDSLNQLRSAGCQIFAQSQDGDEQKIFDNSVSLVTPIPKGTCDCKTAIKTWNPDEYQIRGVPVIYLNGKQDPNTSYAWAKSQFDGQVNTTDKVFLSSKYGGHNELGTKPLKSCADELFDSLITNDISSIKKRADSISSIGCENSDASKPFSSQPATR